MSSPLDGLTFFTDRDLGPTQGCDVVQILRDHGLRVEPHNSHFPEDPEHVDDHVWLKLCADNGWVPLSCDNEIGRSPLSKKVIMEGGVQLFVHRGTWTHPQRALNLANTSEKIARWLQRSTEPRIVRVYMPSPHEDELWNRGKPGRLEEWLTYEHWEQQQRERDEKAAKLAAEAARKRERGSI